MDRQRLPGLGRGSQFRVWLALDMAAKGSETSMTADERGLEGLRILLVDDEPLLLETLSQLLEMQGATVVSVDAASRAVEIARSAPFDVVVSDIAIPVLDGYRLANQWRAARSWTPE